LVKWRNYNPDNVCRMSQLTGIQALTIDLFDSRQGVCLPADLNKTADDMIYRNNKPGKGYPCSIHNTK